MDTENILLSASKNDKSELPIIDHITMKLFTCLNDITKTVNPWRKLTCTCGKETSYTADILILLDPCNAHDDSNIEKYSLRTTFLSVHHIAFHREEIPESELKKIEKIQRIPIRDLDPKQLESLYEMIVSDKCPYVINNIDDFFETCRIDHLKKKIDTVKSDMGYLEKDPIVKKYFRHFFDIKAKAENDIKTWNDLILFFESKLTRKPVEKISE